MTKRRDRKGESSKCLEIEKIMVRDAHQKLRNQTSCDEMSENPWTKDEARSVSYLEEGKRLSESNNHTAYSHTRMLILYSKGVSYAPKNSIQLAIAYAGRSELLIHLVRYRNALEDVDRALTIASIPKSMKIKLMIRRVECLAGFRSLKTQVAYEKARFYVNKMDSVNKENDLSKLDLIMANMKKLRIYSDHSDSLLPKFEPQKYIPSAADVVELKRTGKFSRQLIATRDIRCGEVFIIENPYCTYIDHSDGMYVACAYCTKFMYNGICCDECSFEVYCSEECKKIAWEKYHDIECLFSGFVWKETDYNKMNKSHYLSLRTFIQIVKESGSVENLRKTVEKIEGCKDVTKKGFTSDGYFYSDHYESALSSLFMNVNVHNSSMKIRHWAAAMAVQFVHYLNFKTSLFGQKHKIPTTSSIPDDILFYAALLTRCLLVIPFITDQRALLLAGKGTGGDEKFKQMMIRACNLFPFITNISHSCNANAECIEAGRLSLTYAKILIRKGTEITLDNGYPYYRLEKDLRSSNVSKLCNGHCNCQACVEDWPLITELPLLKHAGIPDEVYFDFMKRTVDIKKKCIDLQFGASDRLIAMDLMPHIAKVIEEIQALQKSPSKDFIQWMQFLYSCLSNAYGTPYDMVVYRCTRKKSKANSTSSQPAKEKLVQGDLRL